MKPLLTVPLTSEDSAILARVWVRSDALWHALVYPHLYGGNQDHRDAALMLSIAAVEGKARRLFMLWAGVTLGLELRTLAQQCV